MPRKSRQQKGGVWPFDTDTDACKSAKEVEKTEVAAAKSTYDAAISANPDDADATPTHDAAVAAAESKRADACTPAVTGGKRRRKTASKRASKKRKSRKSRKSRK